MKNESQNQVTPWSKIRKLLNFRISHYETNPRAIVFLKNYAPVGVIPAFYIDKSARRKKSDIWENDVKMFLPFYPYVGVTMLRKKINILNPKARGNNVARIT